MLDILRMNEAVVRGEEPADPIILEHQFGLLSRMKGIKHLSSGLRHTEQSSLTKIFDQEQLRVIFEWVTDLTFDVAREEWREDAIGRYLRESN